MTESMHPGVVLRAASDRARQNRHWEEGVIVALSRVICDRHDALSLVTSAGFPKQQIPTFSSPIVFWAKVIGGHSGASKGGVSSILSEATERHPNSAALLHSVEKNLPYGEFDAILLRAWKSGDHGARDILCQRHYAEVHRYITIKVGPGQVAEDLTHQVFEIALRKHMNIETSFSKYLIGCARLLTRRQYRKSKTEQVELKSYWDSLPCLQETAEERAARRQELKILVSLLENLRQDEQLVLALHYIAGESQKDIARRLSCRVSQVNGRIDRARVKLSRNLAGWRPLEKSPSINHRSLREWANGVTSEVQGVEILTQGREDQTETFGVGSVKRVVIRIALDWERSSSRVKVANRQRLEPYVLDELSKVFCHRDKALSLACASGIPSARVPEFITPQEFWTKILGCAHDENLWLLAIEAARRYPSNQVFTDLARRTALTRRRPREALSTISKKTASLGKVGANTKANANASCGRQEMNRVSSC